MCKERTKQQAISQMAIIQMGSTEQRKKELRTEYGLKEHYNPLFTLDIDPFRYTQVSLPQLTYYAVTATMCPKEMSTDVILNTR